MNLAQLHQIKDYGALFDDPRFQALIQYLRANPKPKGNVNSSDATFIIRSEGSWHGWYDCIESALATNLPQKTPDSTPKSPAYSKPQVPNT